MHNEKRLLCEFKLRRDRPLSGKVKLPHLQPQYVPQGHVLCQSRWRAGVGAGQFRSSSRQKKTGMSMHINTGTALVSVVI